MILLEEFRNLCIKLGIAYLKIEYDNGNIDVEEVEYVTQQ